MDPNATLAELRALVMDGGAEFEDPQRAAELFNALDEWITRGGFLPAAWTRTAGA